jgi:hypothetical protein
MKFATKDDLKQFATKDDLKQFATKDDLKQFATKDDLKQFLTKEDLKDALKPIHSDIHDIKVSINRLDEKFDKRIRILEEQAVSR